MPNRLSSFNRLSALRGAANIGPCKTVGTTDADYSTVAAALADCSSGDTVLVTPGEYNEYDLVVPSGVNVIGMGPTSYIYGTATNAVLRVTGSNIISGLKLENTTVALTGTAIKMVATPGDDVVIENCHLIGRADSVYINGDNVTIRNCHLETGFDWIFCGGSNWLVANCTFAGTPTSTTSVTAIVLARTSGTPGLTAIGNTLHALCGDATSAQYFVVVRAAAGTCTYKGTGNSWTYLRNGYSPTVQYVAQTGSATVNANFVNESFYTDARGIKYLANLNNTANVLQFTRCRGLPTATTGTASAIIWETPDNDGIHVLEELVDLTGNAAKYKAMTTAIPSGAVILSTQANIDSAVTGGGTTAKIGIGVNSGDPDQYGLSADLAKNTQINNQIAEASQTELGGDTTLEVCGCTAAGALGDTNITAGTVFVRVVYRKTPTIRTVA